MRHKLALGVAALVLLCTHTMDIAIANEPVRYDDWKMVRVYPATWNQVDALHALGGVQLTDRDNLHRIDYVLPPEALPVLAELGLTYEVVLEDVQRQIDAERARLAAAPRTDPRDVAWYNDYKTFAEMETKLQAFVTDRPDLCTLIDIGDSHEGRDIWCLRISGSGTNKPAVLFNACQHAREWISPPVVFWIADKLVYDYDTDPQIQSLVDRVEFFIVPVVNPDGYVHSWTNDRLWRKNRRDNAGSSCYGVDLNRNWAVGWGGAGASGNPCDITYYGPGPLSEPETQALSSFMSANPQIVSNIDYHSYSQLILSPYGYTYNLPPDHDLFMVLNAAMHDEILAVHGEQYDYGPIASTIYQASGGSVDWCYDVEDIFSFTVELRDTGFYGFELPPDQIIPTCEENLPAALWLAEWSSTPIKISFPAGLPALIDPDTATTVAVDIVSVGETLDTATATLHARVGDSGSFATYPLTLVSGDMFEAVLPATPCGQTLNYYFSAATTGGAVGYAPADAPASTYSSQAYTTVVTFEDDIESDLGWTVGAPDDDATTGIWNRMDPQATDAQPEDDHTPSPGTICWVTDGRAGSSIGTYDIDNGKTTLYSPIFDAAAHDDVRVGYWRWYSNDEGASPNADIFTIDISNDGGGTWVNVEAVGPSGPESSGGWFYHEFQVQDVIAPTANMQMRFVAADEDSGSIVEAAIDDFVIKALQDCPYQPGDMNCDGAIDFSDINPFVLALTAPGDYATQYPTCDINLADLNDNGSVGFEDINPFVVLLTD